MVDKRPGRQSGPELLTQDEAIKLLHLDCSGLKHPKEALRGLRRTRQIGYVKVAGKAIIPRGEIEAYLERNTAEPMPQGAPNACSQR